MKKYQILIIVIFSLTSCVGNVLYNLSSESSEDSLITRARNALNEQDYDTSISIITGEMTTELQSTTEMRELLASAYAGRCGLNFVEYTANLAEQTTGSAFFILKEPFVGLPVSPDDCLLSLQTMDLIGTTANRTDNQNLFSAVVGMVLLGSSLRGYADATPTDGDGTNDIDLCTGFTDAQVDNVILGFGYMSENFDAVSTSIIGSSSSSALTDIMTDCNSIPGGAGCSVTDPTAITPLMRQTMLDLIATQDYGIGSTSIGGDVLLVPGVCL